MKKIYTLLFLGIVSAATSVSAQQVSSTVKPHASQSVPYNNRASFMTNGSRVTGSGYIDYSWLNINDLSYVWRFNSNYVASDTAMTYAGVALNPFIGFNDYTDNVDDFNYATYPTGLSFTVDSVFALITHENNSGANDLLVMQVAALSGTGTLTNTAAVLWSDTLITNTSLSTPTGDWLGSSYLLAMQSGYTTGLGQKVGIVFRYYANTLDTLALIGSSIDDGTGGTTTQSPYPTSFMAYLPYIPTVSPNRNIGYGSPVGAGGWIETQDWEIWAKVTYNDITGISDNELNATLYQNSPNPANGKTIIKYDLAKSTSVSIVFYDIAGKKVKEINEGEMGAGNYQMSIDISDFAKGSYFYSLKTSNGVSLTKKMVITK